MCVVITTSSFGKYDDRPLRMLEDAGYKVVINPYGRKVTSDELICLAKGAQGIIAGTEKIGEKELSCLPDLKVISRCGAGIDNLDLVCAERLGIKIYNTPYGPTDAVAELTVGLIINLLRKINIHNSNMHAKKWNKEMGYLLKGRKVGIIGMGRIGHVVAQLLSAFSVELAYYDKFKDSCDKYQYKELNDLLMWSDIITLHCSTNTEEQPLIGNEQIKLMRNGSWLVNTSRGELINEEALYNALITGDLAGAAVDVYQNEPYYGKLIELDNVILTPHIGSYARDSRIEMEIESVNNLIKGLINNV